jgi:hypothetical protein
MTPTEIARRAAELVGGDITQRSEPFFDEHLSDSRTYCSRAQFWRRIGIPYGEWRCADGRLVLFNRGYRPLWEKYPDQPAVRADPGEWVKWEGQRWFSEDGDSERSRILAGAAVLKEWGIEL